MSPSPATTANIGHAQATSRSTAEPALLNRFRNKLHSAHALMAVALLGAASLPQAAQAQTSLPPVNVPAPPGSGSGGPFGGSGGSTGDNTGCGAACDGSADPMDGGDSGPVIRGTLRGFTTCLTRHSERWRDASGLVIANRIPLSANLGDFVEVILMDGTVEMWSISCIGPSCGLNNVLEFATRNAPNSCAP